MQCRGEVRVYDRDQLSQARDRSMGSLFTFSRSVACCSCARNAKDLALVSLETDTFIEDLGGLKGIMIVAEYFAGWENLGAFFSHIRVLQRHIEKIKRLAIVSNDKLLSMLPHIANHFVVSGSERYMIAQADEAFV